MDIYRLRIGSIKGDLRWHRYGTRVSVLQIVNIWQCRSCKDHCENRGVS